MSKSAITNFSIVKKTPKRTRYLKYRFLAIAGHLNILADDSIRVRRSPVAQPKSFRGRADCFQNTKSFVLRVFNVASAGCLRSATFPTFTENFAVRWASLIRCYLRAWTRRLSRRHCPLYMEVKSMTGLNVETSQVCDEKSSVGTAKKEKIFIEESST